MATKDDPLLGASRQARKEQLLQRLLFYKALFYIPSMLLLISLSFVGFSRNFQREFGIFFTAIRDVFSGYISPGTREAFESTRHILERAYYDPDEPGSVKEVRQHSPVLWSATCNCPHDHASWALWGHAAGMLTWIPAFWFQVSVGALLVLWRAGYLGASSRVVGRLRSLLALVHKSFGYLLFGLLVLALGLAALAWQFPEGDPPTSIVFWFTELLYMGGVVNLGLAIYAVRRARVAPLETGKTVRRGQDSFTIRKLKAIDTHLDHLLMSTMWTCDPGVHRYKAIECMAIVYIIGCESSLCTDPFH